MQIHLFYKVNFRVQIPAGHHYACHFKVKTHWWYPLRFIIVDFLKFFIGLGKKLYFCIHSLNVKYKYTPGSIQVYKYQIKW